MAVELYDEHEQGERVRQWLQSNLPGLIIGLVIALGGVFGFQQYQQAQVSKQSAAAGSYNAIQSLIDGGDLAGAEDYFGQLQGLDESGYYKLAAMALAAAYVDAGRLAPAIEIYQALWVRTDIDSLRGMVGLRLARLLEGQGDSDEALSILSGTAPIGYEGAWAEARGDIYFDQSEFALARQAYQQALDAPTDMGFGTTLIQMKLDATGPGPLKADS